jgi:hypothetical protein
MDFGSLAPDPWLDRGIWAMFARVLDAHNAVLAQPHAFDPYCGRRVARSLSKVGLWNVGCEGQAWTWPGGQTGGRVWQLTFMQLRDQMVTSGLVPAGEVDAVIELCEDPELRSCRRSRWPLRVNGRPNAPWPRIQRRELTR